MPNRNYINQLPVELICYIFSYLWASDILNCLFVSKCFYNIATSSDFKAPLYVSSGRFPDFRSSGNPELSKVSYFLSKFANGIIIDSLGFNFLDARSLACSDVFNFISLMGTYKIRELSVTGFNEQLLGIMMSNQIGDLLFLQNLQLRMDGITVFNLNMLQNLPHAAPNLESLEVHCICGDLFRGTESFDNLKTIWFSGACEENSLPAISSFVKKMPHLTKFVCSEISLEERWEEFFESLPNLEYIDLALDRLVPIKSPNLKELRLRYEFPSPLVVQEQQSVPLSDVETFETVVDSNNILIFLKYYGIGDNLRTLRLFDWDDYDTHIDLEPELWKSIPSLENLYLCQYSIDAKYLLNNIAETCKNLRLVAFRSFLNEDEYHVASLADIQPLADYGIKDIYLQKKLPEKQTKFLLDNGIDVHVVDLMYFFPPWYSKTTVSE